MTLQEYLEKKLGEMALQDANFRERYEDKQKSMKNCLLYITQQAHKQAVGNCAAISDEDVLQMAVHYYQEKDVEPTQETIPAKVVAAPKEETKPKTAVLIPKPQPKKAKKVDNSLQLDLFGGM
jgi:hypothetical protein